MCFYTYTQKPKRGGLGSRSSFSENVRANDEVEVFKETVSDMVALVAGYLLMSPFISGERICGETPGNTLSPMAAKSKATAWGSEGTSSQEAFAVSAI